MRSTSEQVMRGSSTGRPSPDKELCAERGQLQGLAAEVEIAGRTEHLAGGDLRGQRLHRPRRRAAHDPRIAAGAAYQLLGQPAEAAVQGFDAELDDSVAQRLVGAVDLRRGEVAIVGDGAQARPLDEVLGLAGNPAAQLAALHEDQAQAALQRFLEPVLAGRTEGSGHQLHVRIDVRDAGPVARCRRGGIGLWRSNDGDGHQVFL